MTTTTNWPATFKEWLTDTLDVDQLRDLAAHGADAGWPGLTYTSECVEVFDRYDEEIWDLAYEMAQSLGEPILAMITGFRRADMADTIHTFKNLMVWFAAEEYARQLTETNE